MEPEFQHTDGTVRKSHYGDGEQPWDIIVRLGWAPLFAASNVLKYLRRTKDVEDSLKKAQWYWNELEKFANGCEDDFDNRYWSAMCIGILKDELTDAEFISIAPFGITGVCEICESPFACLSGAAPCELIG